MAPQATKKAATAKKPAAKKPVTKKATTAKKPATKKATTAKKPAAKKTVSRFPKKELNEWLRKNSSWDHSAWISLIDDLSKSGFTKWTSTQEGKDEIGLYLESNRK